MSVLTAVIRSINRVPLVAQIAIGIVAAVLLTLISPSSAREIGFLGDIFVMGLKSVAPILVLVLVISAISNHQQGQPTHIRPILFMYVLGTLGAAVIGVIASFMFPTLLDLGADATARAAPSHIGEVLHNLLLSAITNPVRAIMDANFIGILVWAIGLGLALRHSSPSTRTMLNDMTSAVSSIVKVVIHFAPIGIFGLVSHTLATIGFHALFNYAHLLSVLIGSMLAVTFGFNPLLVFLKTRRNPYPLVWQCVRESAVTAFFTRSSAANIPVNLALCKKLGLHEDTYSISIPLGSALNMAGAAITVGVITLAAANTLHIAVDIPTAILLCVVSALAACGTSGVAGGSLLLIPLACSTLGISDDIAMKVVAIGFVISVLQDSFETALNSHTDVVFTAACDPQMHPKNQA
jgi:serine/threonine transporter